MGSTIDPRECVCLRWLFHRKTRTFTSKNQNTHWSKRVWLTWIFRKFENDKVFEFWDLSVVITPDRYFGWQYHYVSQQHYWESEEELNIIIQTHLLIEVCRFPSSFGPSVYIFRPTHMKSEIEPLCTNFSFGNVQSDRRRNIKNNQILLVSYPQG